MAIVEIQRAADDDMAPDDSNFQHWAEAALEGLPADTELVIRIVGPNESQALNTEYRGKKRPTNVLSFPFEAPPGLEVAHLGDLVICAQVVNDEAARQGKPAAAHWAHMVVHGVLHLRGFDHIEPAGANAMEAREIAILSDLGIADPYQSSQD
ncbi:MAG TPA: rRNA maturation RNase YbeY [Chromatiaceae bacterium]|nr:rRNA maturation RNase YbeY [Chromatiaceae bacterium]